MIYFPERDSGSGRVEGALSARGAHGDPGVLLVRGHRSRGSGETAAPRSTFYTFAFLASKPEGMEMREAVCDGEAWLESSDVAYPYLRIIGG